MRPRGSGGVAAAAAVAVAWAAVACGGARGAPRRVGAELTVELGAGTTLVVPAGWWVRADRDRVTLTDPDQELRVVVTAVPERDLARAIAIARSRLPDGAALAPRDRGEAPPPSGGWDAELDVELTARAGRVARAVARRLGATSYVAVIEGDAAAADRRDAQIAIALGSVHPPGLTPESFAGQALRSIDAGRLDAFIDRARAELAVPGAAVAVLVDGNLVYERVIGVRALGEAAPVTPRTRFLVASVTKPMTTLMEAALVDAGTVRWETPVVELLPGWQLADPDTTRAVQLWHMSCACTGMPRQDLEDIFEYADVSAEARLASMRTMRPTTALGETFQYSNLMVAAGGYAAAHAYAPDRGLADAYAAAMASFVFGPIGMTDTTLDDVEVERGDHASPHAVALDGAPRRLPVAIERAVRPILPAGGAWTTLRDLERYLATELADGVSPDGRRVVSAAQMAARRTARVRTDDASGYGLGLDVGTRDGLAAFGHDGGAFGYGTTLLGLPGVGVGIAILTNVRNGGPVEQLPFNAAVTRAILEELYAAKPVAATQLAYYVEVHRRTVAAAGRDVEVAPDAAWLATLAGDYTEPALGALAITGATLDVGEWQSRIGRRIAPDGHAQVVLLDAPFAGGALDVVDRTLVIPGQVTYVFRRR